MKTKHRERGQCTGVPPLAAMELTKDGLLRGTRGLAAAICSS
jgi:hypothetical protein